jgi:hypothetical protein
MVVMINYHQPNWFLWRTASLQERLQKEMALVLRDFLFSAPQENGMISITSYEPHEQDRIATETDMGHRMEKKPQRSESAIPR